MSYPNDNFAAATALTGDSGSDSLHYDGLGDPATSETGEDVYGAGETLWWKWTATFSGTAQVNTRFSPSDGGDSGGLDTKIQVFTDFSTVIASDDDDPDPPIGSPHYNSYAEFTAVTGTTYWFQVDMYGSGQAGTLHLAWGAPPPPPPLHPTIYSVYGALPGRGLSSGALAVGYPVIIGGADLATVDKVQLPGLTVLPTDFTSQNDSDIEFVLPTGPGILSGPLRVFIGPEYDERTVDVLRPESGWRTPGPVSVVGITTQVNTSTSPASAGRFKTVGSSRSGDGGTATYNDDSYPPEKMGYDNGTILEQITVLGIDGGFFYTGMDADGFGMVPTVANIPGNYPPEPSGAPDHWVFEYEGQPSGAVFSTQSPVGLRDALTAPIRTYVALQPTYTDPRLTDTGFEIFAVPASEVSSTEVAGVPDAHITKPQSWFTSDKLIDSALGPNFQGSWSDGFDPAPKPGWVALSTSLSNSSGFDGTGMKATGPGEFRSPPVGATPRFRYYMFCWVGNAPAAGGTIRAGVAWLDTFGAEISVDWGDWHSVLDTTGLDSFENLTLVSANAPDDPAVWSRQLVFQFSGCASLEIDDVNFLYDPGESPSYYPIRELTFPDDALYQDPTSDRLFITLIGATGPGIVGTAEAGKLAYAMLGSSPTVETGDFHLYVTYQPSNWRYWLPAAVGSLPSDFTIPLRQTSRADSSRQYPRAHLDGLRQVGRIP